MTRASRLLRRVEITLCVLGAALLGVALGETLFRWNYQAEQERALQRGPANSGRTSAVSVGTPEVSAGTDATAVVVERSRVAESEADSATGFAGVPEAKSPAQRIEKNRGASGGDPAALGRIEIPRLGVAAIVQDGADETTLARAVGRVRGSARPGEIGNMVLAGHRDTFFRPLRKIKLDDRIRMIVPPHTYEYRVQSLRVVAPEETSVLDSNGVEELTLVTCHPFRFVGPAPDRFIVKAARVN